MRQNAACMMHCVWWDVWLIGVSSLQVQSFYSSLCSYVFCSFLSSWTPSEVFMALKLSYVVINLQCCMAVVIVCDYLWLNWACRRWCTWDWGLPPAGCLGKNFARNGQFLYSCFCWCSRGKNPFCGTNSCLLSIHDVGYALRVLLNVESTIWVDWSW